MNFKKIFGPCLVIFGALFEIADILAWYEFCSGKVTDNRFEIGLFLTFILVAGIGAVTGGMHLFHEAQQGK